MRRFLFLPVGPVENPAIGFDSQRASPCPAYDRETSWRATISDLIHCIYASTAIPDFNERDLPGLLQKARTANGAQAVTGMLLYLEGSFFQILEGAPQVVDALYDKIRQDPRHFRVGRIVREPIVQREFGAWTMGFQQARRSAVAEVLGENDFFADATCLERLDAGRAKKLLMAFRSGSWRADRTGRHPLHTRVS